MSIFFISLSILGVAIFLTTKSRENKILIYNRINNKSQEERDSKNEKNSNEKNISYLITIPLILDKAIYSKLIIILTSFIIVIPLLLTNIIETNIDTFIIIGLITLMTTLYLPKVLINKVIIRRTESVLKSLPFFIDITAACVQSGMTIDNSLSYAAKKFELINHDLSLIMIRMIKRAEINGLESAIKELHHSSNALEIKMFCSALQYSISFGSSVYDQLINLSQDMREMQLLVTEERISKLSAKLTFPLFLFILIPFVVLVISPSVLEILAYVQKI
ncbi:putative tight adherance operon protein [Yersinia frederiksenii]|uniref:Type II secretion system (T2SS), F family protein n=2 Tax=Yersinia frederiksenii TaxID=29484 RepID=A0ABR4W059_YERFR|nr:type II secretion system F family protein [Yersinia frederiksenii]ATM94412.1 tight adherance operon protein [Yersinia frederiksenii]KGA45691.1 type II secretion system (T2SS), F family protein [Yersinia frederiksenii ATCC 33641]SUP77095.1 putative tight adherance operon protein [Yersinia frederiksenii]